ncbi:FecR protein domain protein [Candidatus Magnetomorum sp. HK-1]|nr:FecR protein domain protein [Candidatus Magnetomorum sp. HK-1]
MRLRYKKNIQDYSLSSIQYYFFVIIGIMLITVISKALFAEELIPDNLVIKDGYVPGTGLSIGSVMIVDGEAIIIHENELRGFLAKKGYLLYAGDRLITKSHARISIRLQDKSRISIGSETKITLSRISFDPDIGHRKSFIQMGTGKARFRVKKLSDYKQSSFKIKTPTALIGVRGSDFIIQTTLKRTKVTTLSDTLLTLISLTALDAPPALLHEFEWATVEHGELPSDIEQAAIEAIEKLKIELPVVPEPDEIFIPPPDREESVKKHFHLKTFSKESAIHQIDTKIPSFETFDEHTTETFDEHNTEDKYINDSPPVKRKKTMDFLSLSTEPEFSVKQNSFPEKENFPSIDNDFEKYQHIRVAKDEIISPEEIFVFDLSDEKNIPLDTVESLNEEFDEDIEDQEKIYEEEQMDNIHLPWFPNKPEH